VAISILHLHFGSNKGIPVISHTFVVPLNAYPVLELKGLITVNFHLKALKVN
jgi:hypothetical protein